MKPEQTDPKSNLPATETMSIPFLDPHEVLQFLHQKVGIRVGEALVENYWKQAAENGLPWALQQSNHKAIPVGIYGDETKYGLHESQEKILGIFLNLVLFRPRNIRLSRFLICSIRSKFLLPGSSTLHPILKRIVWSMGWASKGVFPTLDMDGSEFMNKKKAMLAGQQLGAEFLVTELRGDQAWHKMIWGFKDGWKSRNVCPFCRATSTGRNLQLLYTNTGDQAAWRATIYRDVVSWMANKLPLDDLCKRAAVANVVVLNFELKLNAISTGIALMLIDLRSAGSAPELPHRHSAAMLDA